MKFKYVEPTEEYKEDSINYVKETIEGHDGLVRRYVIDVDKSIEEYKDKYEKYLI